MKPVLLCGIPASGKSTYGRWMQATHDALFVDLEEPGALELAGLRSAWDEVFAGGHAAFVARLLTTFHRPVVLAWGFPPRHLRIVAALKEAGMSLWWLDGDRDAARESFVAAAQVPVSCFDTQMGQITQNWRAISDVFGERVIRSVHAGPRYSAPEEIFRCMESGIESSETAETPDPNDSTRLRDQIKGQTTEHATPPRLEDEGQSGG